MAEIGRRGGRRAQAEGTGHRWDAETAALAARKPRPTRRGKEVPLLRAVRQAAGLSQKELARRADHVQGHCTPNPDWLAQPDLEGGGRCQGRADPRRSPADAEAAQPG
jgi:hypothetical protein